MTNNQTFHPSADGSNAKHQTFQTFQTFSNIFKHFIRRLTDQTFQTKIKGKEQEA
jgi:hypothetical protein